MPSRIPKKQPWWITGLLAAILVFLIASIWSIFISGPQRIYELRKEQALQTIHQEVPEIMGLNQNIFTYVTWQGYTDEFLYWFDETGQILTSRHLSTLDYQKAREIANERFNIEDGLIELAFGYSHPVYQISDDEAMILLNYDDFQTVYYRRTDS